MRRVTNGFTLIECVVALLLLVIGLAAALTAYVMSSKSDRFTEERRRALQAAVEKIDEIRRKVAKGASLDGICEQYWPFIGDTKVVNGILYLAYDTNNQHPLPAFKVPGLIGDSSDAERCEYVGTISLIIDEMPNEKDYGVNYTVNPPELDVGVDINGNNYYNDSSSSDIAPSPFPLDLNGNGTKTDTFVTTGLCLLPVVITVRWNGVFGVQRVDLFTIIFPDKKV